MELIIYTKTCLPCRYRRQTDLIKQFAREKGIKLIVKKVRLSNEYMIEAERIGAELPFLYNPDRQISIDIKTATDESIEEIL